MRVELGDYAVGLSSAAADAWHRHPERALAPAERLGAQAFELSALAEPELGQVEDLLAAGAPYLERVSCLSVHAPAKGITSSWSELISRLEALPSRVGAIVAHPDVLPDDLGTLRPLGPRLVLENMDRRKQTARTPAELKPYFAELPEAGLCLDLSHVCGLDPEMGLAHELLTRFGYRLRQLHLSGVDGDGRHAPLTRADLERYAPVLRRCAFVPWLLERMPEPSLLRASG